MANVEEDKPLHELTDEEFLAKHYRLVPYTIFKYFGDRLKAIEHSTGMTADDLKQFGYITLMAAKRNFKEESGVKFSTYAVPTIWGHVYRRVQEGGIVKINRATHDLACKISKRNLKEESPEGIAEMFNVPIQIAKDALNYKSTPVSLNSTCKPNGIVDSEGSIELMEFVETVEDFSDSTERQAVLQKFMETLSKKEVRIYTLHSKGLNQREVSELVGVSQVQVSRILRGILNKAEKFGRRQGLHKGG